MKTFLSTNLLLFILLQATAQSITPQVVNIAGGSYKAGYYRIDWSVGEAPAIMTMIDSSHADGNKITNGYIQPNTDKPSVRNTQNEFTGDEIVILPNPTRGMLEINFLTTERGKIQLMLFDRTGALLKTMEFRCPGFGFIQKVDMTGMSNGVYALKLVLIADPGYTSKKGIYKIIKAH